MAKYSLCFWVVATVTCKTCSTWDAGIDTELLAGIQPNFVLVECLQVLKFRGCRKMFLVPVHAMQLAGRRHGAGLEAAS